ncbi:MAG: hypothetical protein ABJD11_14350 [Gemmatimonadota bacterium]
MRNLGMKIGVGVLAVFTGGMILITIGRNVRSAFADTVSNSLARLPALAAAHLATHHRSELPFRLAANRIGSITRISIEHAGHGLPPDVTMLVRLDSNQATSALVSCDLVPRDGRNVEHDTDFRCARDGEHELTEIGTVRFDPGALSRPLLVTHAELERLSRGGEFKAAVDLVDRVHVTGNGEDGEFALQADSNGADVRIDGKNGQSILRLFADSNGAFLRIRDHNGKELVRLRADEHGVALNAVGDSSAR